jgi:hypothetical protein
MKHVLKTLECNILNRTSLYLRGRDRPGGLRPMEGINPSQHNYTD